MGRLELYISGRATPAQLHSSLHAIMVFSHALAITVVFLAALVNAATYTGKVQVINGEGSSNGFLKNWDSGL